jgi:D-alanyl-D-alanine carboxypeptidase
MDRPEPLRPCPKLKNVKGVSVRQASRRFSFFNSRPVAAFLLSVIVAASTPFQTAQAASSKYAAIVMDARTGKVLHAENADSRRYPASLTKMMTLYLVFEALSKGKIKKSTPVVFSAQAATQPPTKIGVKAGKSISVETAIYSLITRSANDASVALAELIGGSEQNFARMMTAKAQALGMKSTVFRNPHGLPNTGQFTTARDMARLGIALREHYPQYYGYFSTRSFRYRGTRIANHNRLLGRVAGVDGIKTGYTRASGFNLVSSVTDGNRRLVAVVMGGASGRARDARMAQLIAANMKKTTVRGGGALVAKADGVGSFGGLVGKLLPKRNAPVPAAKPVVVEDVQVAESEEEIAALEEQVAMVPAAPKRKAAAAAVVEQPAPEDIPFQVKESVEVREQAYVQPAARPKAVDPISTASLPKGWTVQVGSSPSESEARAVLEKASARGSQVLASASAFTVTFEKDGVTYHRARFGGFASQNAAVKACNQLKRKKVECYAVQQ